jgi:hypothetical protein
MTVGRKRTSPSLAIVEGARAFGMVLGTFLDDVETNRCPHFPSTFLCW